MLNLHNFLSLRSSLQLEAASSQHCTCILWTFHQDLSQKLCGPSKLVDKEKTGTQIIRLKAFMLEYNKTSKHRYQFKIWGLFEIKKMFNFSDSFS